MKRLLLICVSLLAGLSGAQIVLGQDAPASAEQLRQEFETALKAKDKAAILALYNWDGVSDWVKAYQAEDIDDWLTREVKDVKLSPLPPGFPAGGQRQGNVRFHPSVKLTGQIEAEFTDGFEMGFHYGRKGDAYYLAGMVTEKIPVPETETNGFLAINVQTVDGKPLPRITVVSGAPRAVPWLYSGKLHFGDREFLADEQGRLNLPLTATNLFLVAANDQGFGWLPNSGLTNEAALVIQPWAQIEGIRKNRNYVMNNENLSWSLDGRSYAVPPVFILPGRSQTDARGHFTFKEIPPLKLTIDWQQKSSSWLYFCSLEAKPGETNYLELVTRGRTVFGKVIPGAGLAANFDMPPFSGTLGSVVKGREGLRWLRGFQVSSNGYFQANLVEPGDYKINGDVWQGGERIAMLDSVSVHVPDDTSDAADVPFDMGTVTLNPSVNLKPGDIAPDFTTATVDGRTLKLSDFRGKYVLLDFWATWCGPCVAETPNLKATDDAFGGDKRLAMVSLSLDPDRAAPKKFAQIHQIGWTQGFLGDWSNDKVTQKYGVFGIPSIFLIGPGGRIVATGLRGAKIKQAVAAALASAGTSRAN